MKCPKCNYTSFDYLDSCKRCGADLRDSRTLLQIIAVSPEEQAPTSPEVPPEEPGFAEQAAAAEDRFFGDQAEPAAAGLEEEEVLEGLDFDGSFDDLVEHTSYADQEPEFAPTEEEISLNLDPEPQPDPEPVIEPTGHAEPVAEAVEEEEEDELLELDFGDLFEEKES